MIEEGLMQEMKVKLSVDSFDDFVREINSKIAVDMGALIESSHEASEYLIDILTKLITKALFETYKVSGKLEILPALIKEMNKLKLGEEKAAFLNGDLRNGANAFWKSILSEFEESIIKPAAAEREL
jgi:hypothetical protein